MKRTTKLFMHLIVTALLIIIGFATFTIAQPCETLNFVSRRKDSGTNLQVNLSGPATGDFNRDGVTDIVYANFSDDTFTVFFGNRNPSLPNSSTFGITDPIAIATADFDRNGIEDIAILTLNNNNSSTVVILKGDTFGGFIIVRFFSVTLSNSIATGDFNNDGKADLVTGNQVRLGNGTSTMTFSTPTTLSVSGIPSRTAIADINKDGKQDILMTISSLNTVAIFLGNGDGTFANQVSVAVGQDPIGLKISDVNRDGNPDIITGNRNGQSISVLLGTGTGGFGTLTNFSMGSSADFVDTGDFNGDGKLDIVASGTSLAHVKVLVGNGTGGFSAPVSLSQSVRGEVKTGDFTGDGMTDIFAGNNNTTTIGETFVLENGCGGYTRNPSGDFDGDGFTDIAVYRPSQGLWIILNSADNTVRFKQFGLDGDIPLDGDFDGDGKNDFAIYRPSNGLWFVEYGRGKGNFARQFGTSSDKPVTDDYDKDGKTDLAFFRPSSGEWFIVRSSDGFNSFFSFPFGQNGDIPIVKKGP